MAERPAAYDVEGARRAAQQAGVTGVNVPAMPTKLARVPAWICAIQNLFAEGRIDAEKLREARRSAAAVGDAHRAMAEVRKADAALEVARANTSIARTLAEVQHGGAVVALLDRVQQSIDARRQIGPRRALSEPA